MKKLDFKYSSDTVINLISSQRNMSYFIVLLLISVALLLSATSWTLVDGASAVDNHGTYDNDVDVILVARLYQRQ